MQKSDLQIWREWYLVSVFGCQGTAKVWPFTCSHWETRIVHPFQKNIFKKKEKNLSEIDRKGLSAFALIHYFQEDFLSSWRAATFTCCPCAQFGHMELLVHSLMIYYFQREIFTIWEAMHSSSKASIWGLGRLQVRGKIYPVPKSQLSSKISNW